MTIPFIGILLLALLAPAAAPADRAATKAEAKKIRKAFLKGREEPTKIRSIRVSTKNPRYAAVAYSVRLDDAGARLRATRTYRAPVPVILKKKKGAKWKPAGKVPAKIDKELGAKAKSSIRISGEVTEELKRSAPCSAGGGYYGAGIYEKPTDTYLSIQIPSWSGYGLYPALAVKSLAALSVGNGGTTPMWETGQGSDAFASSGVIYVDRGWGIIEATMARTGGVYPQSVTVSGIWICR